ncbi:MAG TPA: hypothetical protein VMU83_07660 [Hanamia sp.]|nr:hypothetical protein [Hanamia sp.]
MKKKTSFQISTGNGSYIFNDTSVNTNDTLNSNLFTGGKNLTMAATTGERNFVFIFNMPSQNSGTFDLSDGGNPSAPTLNITGYFRNVNFASTGAPTDILTKTGANSFTFSCKVYDENNQNNTYTLTGSGTY